MALEVVDVLEHGFFEVKGFEGSDASAEELVTLVVVYIYEYIQSFSPKMIASPGSCRRQSGSIRSMNAQPSLDAWNISP